MRIFYVLSVSLLLGLAAAQTFSLRSPDIAAGETSVAEEFLLNDFGCTGQNLSPALEWSDAPADTKSFALIFHDLDAPTGVGGFTHWIVYDIPASATNFAQGAGAADGAGLPTGSIQATTSFGTVGWGGPCPPEGDEPHRYEFTMYALGVEKLEPPTNASQALLGFYINSNAIGKASFTVLFGR